MDKEGMPSAQGVTDVVQRVDLGGAIDIHRVTVLDVIIAVAVIILAAVLAALVRRWVRSRVGAWEQAPDYLAPVSGRFASWAVILLGVVVAVDFLGANLNNVLMFFMIAVVVMAFAGRDLLRNLAAAAVLQAKGPFHIGDQVRHLDYEGTVEEVNSRVTVIRGVDGRTVYEPNINLLNETVVNLTQQGHRRSSLTMSVAYETDLQRAQDVMQQAMMELEAVRQQPLPRALVATFEDSTIDFELRYWHGPGIDQEVEARSAVAIGVRRALRDEGIEIAFPQRVLSLSDDTERLMSAIASG